MANRIIDVSEHQYVQALSFYQGTDAGIVRACNGRRLDYRYDGHVAGFRRAGKPVSLYAYCEPSGPSPESTAGLLVAAARQLVIPTSTTLWADIEEGSGDLWWYEARFIRYVNAAGWPCGTYSGDYFWGAHGLEGPQGKWKAAYGSNDGRAHTAPHAPWDLWQYTSNPLDYSLGDDLVVARLFGGSAAPSAAPRPRQTGILGMLCRDRDTGTIWLVAPGHAHAVETPERVNQLKFVGCADAGDMSGLEVIAWAQRFHAWDYAANDFIQ